MTAQIIDMKEWKYTKIAEEFVKIRATDSKAAAEYAKSKVPKEEFSILSQYIKAEITRQNGV